jgi:hypothetical protein
MANRNLHSPGGQASLDRGSLCPNLPGQAGLWLEIYRKWALSLQGKKSPFSLQGKKSYKTVFLMFLREILEIFRDFFREFKLFFILQSLIL